MVIKTVAQQQQQQKAALVMRLHVLDPERLLWALTDSYAQLLATFYYLTDRRPAAEVAMIG
jgi:hypothetical protein